MMSFPTLVGLAGAALLAWLNRKKLSSGVVTATRAASTVGEDAIVLVFRDLRAVAQRCDSMGLDGEADRIRTLAAEILAAEANLTNFATTPQSSAPAPQPSTPAPTPAPAP